MSKKSDAVGTGAMAFSPLVDMMGSGYRLEGEDMKKLDL